MLKTNDFVRSVLGINPNNSMRYQNGLDEIDLEAMRQGSSARKLNRIRPARLERINKESYVIN